MPKRKRSSPSGPSNLPVDPVARQKKLCTQRIDAAQKPLLAALRLGAGFERQKHSRRKKTAQAKNDAKALERLEFEYTVLKALNLEQLADQHLRRTLGKVKSLKEAGPLKEYIDGARKSSADAATLNVTARLYKVPGVKAVVDEVIADLKGILGQGGGAENPQTEGKKVSSKKERTQEDDDMPDVSDNEHDPYAAFNARIAAPSSGEEDSADSMSDDERPPSIGDSDSEHDPDADLDAASIASSSSSASFTGFSSDPNAQPASSRSHAIAPPSDHSASDSDSDSDSSSASASIPTKKLKAIAKTDAKPTSSAFLPALSHAAYVSGSESEASDLDEAPRKNRRGQRARQKLAELKFGAKAKHLEKAERKGGWDARKGAVEERGGRGRGRADRRTKQSGGNMEPLGRRAEKAAAAPSSTANKRDDKGDLHPSWQAAKAAKESKKLKIDTRGAGAGGGKKVVFD
ncbi:hypothetical protein ACN47E_000585 [Coniothyrium glycines]